MDQSKQDYGHALHPNDSPSPNYDAMHRVQPNERSPFATMPLSGPRRLQERYPPLTFDRLEKKNKLDALKRQILSSRRLARASLTRRRSIASGQIYRTKSVSHPPRSPNAESSRSSIESVNSVYSDRSDTLAHHHRPSSHSMHSSLSRSRSTSSRTTGRSLDSQRRFLAPSSASKSPSLIHHSRLSRPSFGSSMHRLSCLNTRAHPQCASNKHPHKRRLAKFLEFSTTSRSKSLLSRPSQVGVTSLQKLLASAWAQWIRLAIRIVDTRSCELLPFKLSVKHLSFLGTYLHVLRTDSNLNERTYYQDGSSSHSGGTSPLLVPSPPGSLPACLSAFTSRWTKSARDNEIRLKGWSLWLFPPYSPFRLFLWRLIASAGYKSVSLVLLFAQWITISAIPIDNHEQKTSVDKPEFRVLMAINAFVLFDVIVKIIVYGFVLETWSETPPVWKDRMMAWFQNTLLAKAASRAIHPLEQRMPFISHSMDQFFEEASDRGSATTDSRSPTPLPPWMASQPDEEMPLLASAEPSPRSSVCLINNPHDLSPTHVSYAHSPSLLHDEQHHDDHQLSHPTVISLDHLKIDHNPFLSDIRNALDLVSGVAFWMNYFLLSGGLFIPVLPAAASLRILRLLFITDGTKVIMQSLNSCMDMFFTTLGFFALFWLLFSMAAQHIFLGAMSRQCAAVNDPFAIPITSDALTLVRPPQMCNSYYNGTDMLLQVYDIDANRLVHGGGLDGGTCQSGQVCIQSSAFTPFYSYLNFDNILSSLLNTFTVISTEGWTDIMYACQDSMSSSVAAVFYSLCVYLMTLVLVPMFIAVITSTFSYVRSTEQKSAFSMEAKKERLLIPTTERTGLRKQDGVQEDSWMYEGHHHLLGQQTHKLQLWVHSVITHPWFRTFGSVLVISNTFVLTLACSHPLDRLPGSLVYANRAIHAMFTLEIVLRIYGSGPKFWSSMCNRVDLILVIGALANLLLVDVTTNLFRILELFSVCRCYRLIYLLPRTLDLLSSMIGDGQGVLNLTVFTVMVLLLLTSVSMQVFGGDFGYRDAEDEFDPGMRFDSFYQSFLSIYQIMTGENWTDILYDSMHSQSYFNVTYAAIYMVFLYFTVHYMVLNMFIAVIMENFDLEEDEIREIQVKRYVRQHRWQPEVFLPFFMKQNQKQVDVHHRLPSNLMADIHQSNFTDFLKDSAAAKSAPPKYVPLPPRKNLRRASIWSASTEFGPEEHQEPEERLFWNDKDGNSLVKYGDEYELNVAREDKAVLSENMNLFHSFIYLSPKHPIRNGCHQLITTPLYDQVMMALTITSAALSVWTDWTFRQSHPHGTLMIEYIQIALLAIFFVDSFLHMVVYGVIVLPTSYLRNVWQVFDFLLLISQVAIKAYLGTAEAASLLRCIRTIRILNIIYYIPAMKALFLDTVYGVPKLLDAAALNLVVFIPFAIYGCFLFAGRFASCNDTDVSGIHSCFGEYLTGYDSEDLPSGLLLPRVWANPYHYSYDTFWAALLHLFECASGEGWIMSLFTAMSVSPSSSAQAKFSWHSNSIWYSFYYVAFMFISSICSIQLFIGVFLESFKQRNGISSLTNYQRHYQDLQRRLNLVKPRPHVYRPEGWIRQTCYNLVIKESGWFLNMAMFITILNIATFASFHLHQQPWVRTVQAILLLACLAFYLAEIFTLSSWNMFDLLVVPLATVLLFTHLLYPEAFPVRILYVIAQVLLCLRLCQKIDALDTLIGIAQKSIAAILYIVIGDFMMKLCFSVAFQEVFYWTSFGLYGSNHVNFRALPTTFSVVFRITTGENWDFLMHDFAKLPPLCVNGGDCGSPVLAYTLFIVYYVVCTYIFENLLIVVVISNFSFTFDKRNQFTQITRTDIRQFKKAWMKCDPGATGYIHKRTISKFLQTLEGALSIHMYNEEHRLSSLLKASEQVDADITHIVSIPVPSKSKYRTNILNERFYNYARVNSQLSTMDIASVKEAKLAYNRLYHELTMALTPKGLAFKTALDILSLRLLDATKALTFDEFVAWSRKQDEIDKQIATERTKNALNMLVQRQKYLREQQLARDNQVYDTMHQHWNSVSTGAITPASSSAVSQTTSKFQLDPRNSTFFEQPLFQTIFCPSTPSGLATQEDHPLDSPASSSRTDLPSIVIDRTPRINVPRRRNQSLTLDIPSFSYAKIGDVDPAGHVPVARDTTPSPMGPSTSRSSSASPFATLEIPNARPDALPQGSEQPPSTAKALGHRRTRSLVTLRVTTPFIGLTAPQPQTPAQESPTTKAADLFVTYFADCRSIDTMKANDSQTLMKELDQTPWSDLLADTINKQRS
ncbi:hypothetical protein DM01DRAFT_1372373 [Hesseltinella vesiculosa]|uniref:Ion transport domain-containing protein n=1 Tax=Hesseltinella vesiculosa TaxID=101127 RepID=A0A1X2GPP3_9FUNG|nr:hypothetical protein DM01DRAFT_1372373 [Hesseltinella vesiculosa]